MSRQSFAVNSSGALTGTCPDVTVVPSTVTVMSSRPPGRGSAYALCTTTVCRPAGTLSVPGVYGGLIDKIPFGAFMNKGLTMRTGQTHVNRWTDDLLRRIDEGQIDPSFVITHTVGLEEGPGMYKTFRDKHDGCIKVVLKPGQPPQQRASQPQGATA